MENFSVHSKLIGLSPQIFTLKNCAISILIAAMIKTNNHWIISDIENCIKKSYLIRENFISAQNLPILVLRLKVANFFLLFFT